LKEEKDAAAVMFRKIATAYEVRLLRTLISAIEWRFIYLILINFAT